MLKAVGDRLAEAYTEYIHERIRKEWWGYDKTENLTVDDLLKVKYKGIRPACGYPMQPDHTENLLLFDLLNVKEKTSIFLTESLAMWPANTVSALLIGNEKSFYFNTNEICKDQVVDYARRKNMPVSEIEKWLKTTLSYEID